MKELTIEEKARAYDEAIKVARSKIKNDKDHVLYEEDITDIFPVLIESEDERIRKELIEQVVYIVPNDDEVDNEGNVLPIYQKRIDKYRVWLEKRAEQKSSWSEEDERIYQSIMDDTVQENQLDGKQIDWLRNIRYRNFAQPKYTWKPSREQMDAVKSAALDVAKFSSRSEQLRLENEPYYKALMSLYNDLEKLREE